MSAAALHFQDERSLPVSIVRHEDADSLAAVFEGRDLPLARSLYFAVVQLVAQTEGPASVTRKELATLAGISVRKLDELTKGLVEHRLLHVVQRREDGLNLPNLYGLGGGGWRTVCASAAHDTQQSSSFTTTEKDEDEGKGCGEGRYLESASSEMTADAKSLLKAKQRVGGRQVTRAEMEIAVAALATFNVQSGREVGVSAHLTAIVGRIRERPSWDAPAHVRLVESAFRLKWWERPGFESKRKTRISPAVIYGNERVFEQVVQDAIDEKKGVAPQGTSKFPPGYFTKKSDPWKPDF